MGKVILSGVSKGMTVPSTCILLSDFAEGSIVKINENGSPVDFYVAKHDYESGLNGNGRTLLVRKDCYDMRAWNSTDVNDWEKCTMRSWLNSEYLNLMDEDIRGMIGTTIYYFIPGNGITFVTTRSDAIFLLSATELGLTSNYVNTVGTVLDIASTLHIAYLDGSTRAHWTRCPRNNETTSSCACSNGIAQFYTCRSKGGGSRPAFTLPSTALFDKTTLLLKGA